MSDYIISVKGIWKKYAIGQRLPYSTLRDFIVRIFNQPLHLLRRRKITEDGLYDDEFWALKNISFNIKKGEVVGFIGRNGAGKSTILKILSRITPPTKGEIRIKGRVASLLEIGTGFQQELTGRENIFLNGSILGMKQKEIRKKFTEIVEFAEIEKFLDTPVKHYSTGMYMRLAFSIAAHLEPEILIIDEVLAVGDLSFQKKCLGKMGEVAKSGRTVIFVSHNMNAINRLCTKVFLIHQGSLIETDSPEDAIQKYMKIFTYNKKTSLFMNKNHHKSLIQITKAKITGKTGQMIQIAGLKDQLQLEIDFIVRKRLIHSFLSFYICKEGERVFCSYDTDLNPELFEHRDPGYYNSIILLPGKLLLPGNYTISISTNITQLDGQEEKYEDILSFEVDALSEDIQFKSYSQKAMVMTELKWLLKEAKEYKNLINDI